MPQRTVPNDQLRQARYAKGWTQQQVADALGTNHFTVARWERGVANPSPYFRRRLCDLFAASPATLGFELPPHESGEAERTFVAPLVSAVFPPISLLQQALVGHDTRVPPLIAQVMAQIPGQRLALYGLPGVGKTTLAVALALAPAVQEHFPDGILWAGLGRQPHLLALLGAWAVRLGLSPVSLERLHTPEALCQTLRTLLETRRMLLVIDDAWTLEEALIFQIGGRHCATLLTTRMAQLATRFAQTHSVVVTELSEDQGLDLLAHLAPRAVAYQRESARQLVQAVGGLPLALTLMGHYLHQEAVGGQTRRIATALAALQQPATRLHLVDLLPPGERPSTGVTDGHLSLAVTIDLSVQALDPMVRTALSHLALFPPKPQTFSEAAGHAVSGLAADEYDAVLDTLVDAGLVESYPPDRYTLHATIRDVVWNVSPAAVQRLVIYYDAFVQRFEKDADYVRLDGEVTNMLTVLQLAFDFHLDEEAVRLTQHSALFLVNRGYYQEAESALTRCRALLPEEASSPEDIGVLLLLGITLKEQGKLTDARVLAEQVGVLAKAKGMEEMEAAALKLLGQLLMRLGEVAAAEDAFQQGQHLIEGRTLQYPMNRTLNTALLVGLAQCAARRGDYAHAEAISCKGLALARQEEKRQSETIFLSNLGKYAGIQGDHERAQHYFTEALVIARRLGFVDNIMVCLSNLALTAIEQDQWERGQQWGEESVALARQLGQRQRLCEALSNLARITGELHKYEIAERYLQEGLALAEEMEDVVSKVSVLHSQARLARLRQLPDAEQLLHEGRDIAKAAHVAYVAIDFDLELGEWYLARAEGAHALFHFSEAHHASEHGQSRARWGQAMFGKARVFALMGEMSAAHQAGEVSLALFIALNHVQAKVVRQWLANHTAQPAEEHS